MLIKRDEELPEIDRDLYNDFVSRVEVQTVNIRAFKSEFIRAAYDSNGGDISFEIRMDCLRDEVTDGEFMAVGTVRVKAKSKKTRKICKRIECTMEALYRVNGDFDEAMLAHFERNALFNLWPYLREAVHEGSIKMDGPRFILPLLRL